jgi:hypothetical protein
MSSMLAAAVAAIGYLPSRIRLMAWATRWGYGERQTTLDGLREQADELRRSRARIVAAADAERIAAHAAPPVRRAVRGRAIRQRLRRPADRRALRADLGVRRPDPGLGPQRPPRLRRGHRNRVLVADQDRIGHDPAQRAPMRSPRPSSSRPRACRPWCGLTTASYRPWKWGRRFCAKALRPSAASSVAKQMVCRSRSYWMAFSNGTE